MSPSDPTSTVHVGLSNEADPLWLLTTNLICTGIGARCLGANPACTAALGWSREELLGFQLTDLAHPDDRDEAGRVLATAADRPGEVTVTEIRCRHRDGGHRIIRWSVTARDVRWYASGEDRTAERAAQRSAERWRALLDALREGIVVVDGDGRILDVSEQFCALTGFTQAEVVGATAPFPFWPPEDAATLAGVLGDALSTPRGTVELTLRRKDGDRFPVLADLAPHCDVDGRPGFLAVVRDVTELVEVRDRLRDSEARLLEAQRVARMTTWEWTPAIDAVDFDGRLPGVPAGPDLPLPTLAEAASCVAGEDRGPLLRALRAVAAGARDHVARVRVHDRDRGIDWIEVRARAIRDAHGRVVSVRGTVQDVSEFMRSAEEALARARLLAEVDLPVIATDLAGAVTYFNPAAERVYGWSAAELLGAELLALINHPDEVHVAEAVHETVRQTGRWEGVVEPYRKDGSQFPAHLRLVLVESDDGRPLSIVGVAMDLTERIAAERQLQSARDHLAAITDAVDEGLCAVDGDGRVTYVNPAFERMFGVTPEEVGDRRLGDVLTPAAGNRDDGCALDQALASGISVRVEDDVVVRPDGQEVPVAYTASALEEAGGVRGGVVVFADITERKAAQRKMEREAEALGRLNQIREALDQHRFTLHAQPIVDVATGETVQHELLIRMLDEDGALVPPGQFLPVAEEYGLIREIDRWVIGQAARIAADGHPVEINISARSLDDPDLAMVVERELQAAGADPANVVIEITETALMCDDDLGQSFIDAVSALGCGVALDDFGTGYGGFSYVKRLPVDSLKIDNEFVRDLPSSPASQHVVRAIVQLAKDFGHHTVAEGVEDDETLDLLRELGVEYAQGYGLGRPVPIAETALAAALASAR